MVWDWGSVDAARARDIWEQSAQVARKVPARRRRVVKKAYSQKGSDRYFSLPDRKAPVVASHAARSEAIIFVIGCRDGGTEPDA
ncbi:hypothetical protein SSA02_15120 [Swaminathania salitolerans]|uniref:Uncharacterized protein n=1 Tax=Swaminathania salitolerans TaxID=182838 RepID=A0A511BPT9_9PROT|nr:hypothetical protein SSA02_15120 [Swaminathania salitolerans]